MLFTAKRCVTSGLCISKQFNHNTLMLKQHLRDVMPSPLSGNLLVNKINNNSNKTLVMRDASKGEIKKNAQDAGDAQSKLKLPNDTIRQHLKDEVVSTLSGNIFMNADGEQANRSAQADSNIMVKADKNNMANYFCLHVPDLFQTKASTVKIHEHFKREMISQFANNILMNRQSGQKTTTPIKGGLCGKETKIKLQEYNVILSPPDSLKGLKCAETGKNKQNFQTNAVPPLSGKICVAMQVRFQVSTEMHNEGKKCKIIPKCNQPNSSFNIPKISASSACNKPTLYNNQCKPKTK
ncbi:unnamed protein product [Arctia plantaginis]|uniref:Uncharacterized protein n=1 Tax=Arctia plantaginis TaxID=874455 RepID=A0A8S1AQ19_ARCPL|nr:unnamed protein product [Arctia plantaginis]